MPENLSSTYYDLKWIFPVIIGICGGLTMISWLNALEGSSWQFTGFLCPAAIFFMCSAPDFKKFGLYNYNLYAVTIDNYSGEISYDGLKKFCSEIGVPLHIENTDINKVVFEKG